MRALHDGLTHTVRYQSRHRSAGLCSHCPNPRVAGRTRCQECLEKARAAYRRRKASTVTPEQNRLLHRLMLIDRARERTENAGAVLVSPGGTVYVSGYPHLFSTDIKFAFVFKNTAQAARVLVDFNEQLAGYQVLPAYELEAIA